jgi:hypothetical protein
MFPIHCCELPRMPCGVYNNSSCNDCAVKAQQCRAIVIVCATACPTEMELHPEVCALLQELVLKLGPVHTGIAARQGPARPPPSISSTELSQHAQAPSTAASHPCFASLSIEATADSIYGSVPTIAGLHRWTVGRVPALSFCQTAMESGCSYMAYTLCCRTGAMVRVKCQNDVI